MEMTFKIDQLKEGMTLAKAVTNPKTNFPIAPAGTVLTNRYIEILASNGATEAEVELSAQEYEKYNNSAAMIWMSDVPSTVSPYRTQQLKKSITPITRGRENFLNIQDVVISAASLREDIIKPDPNPYTRGRLSYKLNEYATDTTLTDSSVRIAIYATMVANAYNRAEQLPRDKMIDETEIALAALLHNYGAICSNDEIRSEITIPKLLKYFPSLTEETIKMITENYDERFIPIYSYTLLRDKAELFESSVIKKMIVNSRENRNGTGPLRSKQINGNTRSDIGSLIISLCALYDNALMKDIQINNSVRAADEEITNAYYANDYDRKLIEVFRSCIPLYPVGTRVLIFNENTCEKEYAVVIDNSTRKENYRNPIVVTMEGQETIDLSKTRKSRILELVGNTIDYSNLNINNANNTSLYGHKRR